MKQREDEWEEPSDNVVKLKGADDFDFRKYLPLYQAALRGDWESGKSFLDWDPTALTKKISTRSMTALHVAASSGCWDFVENLVAKMPKEALELKDKTGRTALHYVAVGGNTKVAKAMVDKNNVLTQLKSDSGYMPLYYATNCRTSKKDMVRYLCHETKKTNDDECPFTGKWASTLIRKIIDAGYYDIALYLVQRFPKMAEEKEIPELLQVMAEEPSAFKSSSRLGFCERLVYAVQIVNVEINNKTSHSIQGDMKDLEKGFTLSQSRTSNQVAQIFNRIYQTTIKPVLWMKHIRDMKLKHKHALELLKYLLDEAIKGESLDLSAYVSVLETATKHGIYELVITCLHYFPDLIWEAADSRSIYHGAIQYREEKIYNLLNESNARNETMTSKYAEIGWEELPVFFLVAQLPPYHKLNYVSGAALQLQRELQWFTEIEKSYRPGFKLLENDAKKTAFEVFTETHKDLRKNGEKWMKDTSNSCMVVSTLIATVVFAAAFTVPGGNKSDNGIPIFLSSNSFLIFAISDALAVVRKRVGRGPG